MQRKQAQPTKKQQLASTSTTNSACCILPPEELWPQIQQIRKQYDKSYEKWPPHINLLWPFVSKDQFYQASQALQAKMNNMPSFSIILDTFTYFEDSKYLFLVPSSSKELQALHKVIVESFPDLAQEQTLREGAYYPHMTVGQIADKKVRQ